MRIPGDYEGDMPRYEFTDQDMERLLTGAMPESEDLARLAPLIEQMQRAARSTPSDDVVARVAAEAAEVARTAYDTVETPVGTPRIRSRPRRSGFMRPQPALAAFAAAVLLFAGIGGAAATASDSAVPGDLLYGLDRALERVGIGAGGVSERYAEAITLAEAGKTAAAIDHATEAATEDIDDDEDAATTAAALREAAEAVTSSAERESAELRERVAVMLLWMAENKEADEPVTGREFGQAVAEFARTISGYGEATEESEETAEGDLDGGPPEGVPGGPPEGTPGGPPEGVPGG